MIFSPRFWVDRHSLVDGVCDLLGVPRIDDNASVQTLGSTGKLGKDHHPLSVLLTSDIFVRDLKASVNRRLSTGGGAKYTHQIHTITSTADQADIANGIKSTKLVECQTLVHKVDGHKFDGSEPSINPSNEFVDSRPQVLIFFDVLP